MMTTMQTLFLRWLPISVIVLAEIVLLMPLRAQILATDWGPFATLAGFAVAVVLLVDWRDFPRGGLRIPNPNGLTIGGYMWELLRFALVLAPIILTPMRR